MGKSGMKRKGRQHLPKVGTPQERHYAQQHEERDVVGNFGIHAKGWVFWVALIVIFAIGIAGVAALASM